MRSEEMLYKMRGVEGRREKTTRVLDVGALLSLQLVLVKNKRQ